MTAPSSSRRRSRRATRPTRSRRAGAPSRPARWRSRTCAGAPGSRARARGRSRRRRATSAKPSSTRVRPESSTAVRLEPTTWRWLTMSVTCAPVPELRAHALRDGGRVGAVGLDEERADRVAAGGPGDVARVGDEERVARRGRELLGHAGVVERNRRELLRAPVLQAQAQQVAGRELEVVHGLGETRTPSGRVRERSHERASRCRRRTSRPGACRPRRSSAGARRRGPGGRRRRRRSGAAAARRCARRAPSRARGALRPDARRRATRSR